MPVVIKILGNSPEDVAAPTSVRNLGFPEFTVSAYLSDPLLDPEVIVSVEITEVVPDPYVVITNGLTSSTVSGKNTNQFLDMFTYVEKGSSNLVDTPTTVYDINDLPPNKEFFHLDQDSRQLAVKQYVVKVTYNNLGVQGTFSQMIEQVVMNDYESIRSFVQNYYG